MTVSVIIPTLHEESCLADALRSVRAQAPGQVIVADGGSTDGTIERARSARARVIACPPGRARQMNIASAHAAGDVLLFLHSDTTLPEGYLDQVRRTLARTGVVAGAFRFRTDYGSLAMRLVELSTNLRSRFLQLPYGDQGLFVATTTFRRLAGFRELPIMDDFDFVRRAWRLGRVATAPAAAVTSGARWRRLGVLRTTLRNQIVIARYLLGAPPEQIARYYARGIGDDR
jgi:rSAM/selenodomain-associated transferase 2